MSTLAPPLIQDLWTGEDRLSPNVVVASGWYRHITLLHATTLQPLYTIPTPSKNVRTICFASNNSPHLVSSDHTRPFGLRRYNLHDLTSSPVPLRGHTKSIYALEMLLRGDDKRLLLSGGNDRSVKLWDLELGTRVKVSLSDVPDWTQVLRYEDGRLLVGGGPNSATQRRLRARVGSRRKARTSVVPYRSSSSSLRSVPSLRSPYPGSKVPSLDPWAIRCYHYRDSAFSLAEKLEGHTDVVEGLVFEQQDTVYSVSKDGTWRVWDLRSREQRNQYELSAMAYSCVYAADLHLLMVGLSDGCVEVYDPRYGEKRLQRFQVHGKRSVLWEMCRVREHACVSAGGDGKVCLWNVKGKMLAERQEEETCLGVSYAGNISHRYATDQARLTMPMDQEEEEGEGEVAVDVVRQQGGQQETYKETFQQDEGPWRDRVAFLVTRQLDICDCLQIVSSSPQADGDFVRIPIFRSLLAFSVHSGRLLALKPPAEFVFHPLIRPEAVPYVLRLLHGDDASLLEACAGGYLFDLYVVFRQLGFLEELYLVCSFISHSTDLSTLHSVFERAYAAFHPSGPPDSFESLEMLCRIIFEVYHQVDKKELRRDHYSIHEFLNAKMLYSFFFEIEKDAKKPVESYDALASLVHLPASFSAVWHSRLQRLYKTRKCADLTLKSPSQEGEEKGGQLVHRNVLICQLEFFRKLFALTGARSNPLVIKELFSSEMLDAVVEYAYAGRLPGTISLDTVLQLLGFSGTPLNPVFEQLLVATINDFDEELSRPELTDLITRHLRIMRKKRIAGSIIEQWVQRKFATHDWFVEEIERITTSSWFPEAEAAIQANGVGVGENRMLVEEARRALAETRETLREALEGRKNDQRVMVQQQSAISELKTLLDASRKQIEQMREAMMYLNEQNQLRAQETRVLKAEIDALKGEEPSGKDS